MSIGLRCGVRATATDAIATGKPGHNRAPSPQEAAPPPLLHHTLHVGGDGPLVVGLHGIASGGRTIMPMLGPLAAEGMRVYVPDLLGHGWSPYPRDNAYTVDDHIDALRTWADAVLPQEPFWLVGYSLGAILALAWAAREPERIRGVTVVGLPLFRDAASAVRSLTNADLVARLMLRTPLIMRALVVGLGGPGGLAYRISTRPRLRGPIGRALRRRFGPQHIPGHPPVPAVTLIESYLLDSLKDTWLHSWESLSRTCRRAIIEYRSQADLARVASNGMPLLFIHGGDDTLAPYEAVCEAASTGGWPLIEVPGADHSLALSYAHVVQSLIGRWITESGALQDVATARPRAGADTELR